MAAVPFKRSIARRIGGSVPLAPLLLAAEVALIAARHLSKLDRLQRRRLVTLLGRAQGRPSTLSQAERREVVDLIAVLEPRLFLGSAVRKVSPLPVPKRLLYGPRGSDARKAAAGKR
jgi:hypothetical protein